VDEMQKQQHLQTYLKRNPFPGIRSDIPAKIKWLKAIDDHHMDIMEDSCYSSLAPEASDAVKDILLDTAPELIRVNFAISSNHLDAISNSLGEEQKNKFVLNYQKNLGGTGTRKRKTSSEATPSSLVTFEKCLEWIKENKKASSDEFIIATVKVAKDTPISEFYKKIREDLGIADCTKGGLGNHERSLWNWGLQEKVGQNMYCGDSDDESDGDGDSVHWNIHLASCNTEPESNLSDTQQEVRAFRKLLKDQVAASEARGNLKCYTLVKRKDAPDNDGGESDDSDVDEEDEDEGIPQTPEYFQPLWLPKGFTEHYSRIACHLSSGEGECRDIQQRLEKGNTDSGNIKIELFEYELQYAKKIQTTTERLCAILALSLAASNDDYWMHDNENPQKVLRLIKSLALVWRNDLLLKDDANLGIGIGDGMEEEVDGDGLTTSRALLYQYLGQIATSFENHVKKFQWKPVAKK